MTGLVVQELNDDLWRVNRVFRYYSDVLRYIIEVPAGFETDFASVPRIPLAYWLVGGIAERAAVIHDFLYQTQPCSRKQADDVMLEAMEVTRVIPWRKMAIYAGIRLGGWWAWAIYARRLKNRN